MDNPVPPNSASAEAPLSSPSEISRCSICTLPVSLEAAKADEFGRAIHEECYALKMRMKVARTKPAA
jgi:hypothetical protein